MSEIAEAPTAAPAFSPRIVLALVLVGIVAFAGLSVLSAYAPDLRSTQDGRAHALSKSAVGYAGAPILLKALGVPVTVSRTRPTRPSGSLVILTPEPGLSARDMQAYPKGPQTLIVLPKWNAAPDMVRAGFVRKAGVMRNRMVFQRVLSSYARTSRLDHATGRARPVLRGVDGVFAGATDLRPGPIDQLQTLSGDGWVPLIVDAQGRAVLARSRKTPSIWVLAEPDLLNNQGLASRDTARVALMILAGARGDRRPIVFDTTLNGFARTRGLGRLMLEPPWLAATLIAVAAAVLMGAHALARFGQPRRRGRVFALGARALVDNSADLVRMARREAEFAPAYADLTSNLVIRAAGHASDDWLEDLAARRGALSPATLAAEAAEAKTRDDLLAVARKLHDWRGEMTRERR